MARAHSLVNTKMTANMIGCTQGMGNMVVVDGCNNHIVVLNQNGAIVHVFGSSGSRPGELLSPKGIAINTHTGKIFIAD
jgi:hypothetical protein